MYVKFFLEISYPSWFLIKPRYTNMHRSSDNVNSTFLYFSPGLINRLPYINLTFEYIKGKE